MISIDRFEEILSDLAEEIPQSFYEELNGGIVVEPGYLLHPEDRNGTLYVMGQYRIDPAMGKYIEIQNVFDENGTAIWMRMS